MREIALEEEIQFCIVRNCPALLCDDPHLKQIKAVTDLIQSALTSRTEQCAQYCDVTASLASAGLMNPDLDKCEKEYLAGRASAATRNARQIRALNQPE